MKRPLQHDYTYKEKVDWESFAKDVDEYCNYQEEQIDALEKEKRESFIENCKLNNSYFAYRKALNKAYKMLQEECLKNNVGLLAFKEWEEKILKDD